MGEYFDLRTTYPEDLQKKLRKKILFGEDYETKRYFDNIAKQTDGEIPKDIGEILVRENNNPDYAILIHRTSNIDKETIFENGLTIACGNDICYTTSGYDRYNRKKDSDFNLILGIRDACGYKSGGLYGSRCLIMKVPITALEYKEGISKPILKQTNNIAEQSGGMAVVDGKYQTVLLPEYVLGSIEYEDDKITEFVRNPNYKDQHNYQNDGLVCTEQLISSYLDQKGIKSNRDSERNANETIKIENSEYMKKNEKYKSYESEKTDIADVEQAGKLRTENELKEYSKKDMLISKFNKMASQIRQFFSKDKSKEDKDDIISK